MQLTIGIREYALDLHGRCNLVTIPAERWHCRKDSDGIQEAIWHCLAILMLWHLVSPEDVRLITNSETGNLLSTERMCVCVCVRVCVRAHAGSVICRGHTRSC